MRRAVQANGPNDAMTETAGRYFGTDGIRGLANGERMNAPLMLKLGMAAGALFKTGAHRHRVVVGKDTRLSGYMIEQALTAGFLATGMDVFLFGPIPTPAVSMLTRSLRADLGIIISASHNPFRDNGVKLIGADGYKLSAAQERRIEAAIDDPASVALAPPDRLGRAKRIEDAQARYIEFAKRTLPKDLRLDGMKIVLDCAHGAAYKVAPTALWELGAEIIALNVAPDGFNINENCGSTAPQAMARAVRAHGADFGLALDGDADRVIIADERGKLADGDQIMALIAAAWRKRRILSSGGVIATVMSNLGLERYLSGQGIALHRTRVGDRHVVEAMRARGVNLGGEASGHIVLSDFGATGDGLVAALQVLAVIVASGKPASAVCHPFTPLPQVSRTVRYPQALGSADAHALLERSGVKDALMSAEAALGATGRLVARASGTEPVIRVMVEGDDEIRVTQLADELAHVIDKQISSSYS